MKNEIIRFLFFLPIYLIVLGIIGKVVLTPFRDSKPTKLGKIWVSTVGVLYSFLIVFLCFIYNGVGDNGSYCGSSVFMFPAFTYGVFGFLPGIYFVPASMGILNQEIKDGSRGAKLILKIIILGLILSVVDVLLVFYTTSCKGLIFSLVELF